METVYLLVQETKDIDYDRIQTNYNYVEMPFSEEPSEEIVLEAVRNIVPEAEIVMLYPNGVTVKFKEGQDHFVIRPALKIGNRYFELNELPSSTTNFNGPF